jgi:UDP-N-acetylmuramate--alanine ligase
VVVFQPHRYSRTRDLLDDFAEALSGSDCLFITEVYAAGEDPIAGADGRSICRAVRTRGQVEPVFVPTLDQLPALLTGVLRDGDVLLTLGAGDIGSAAAELPEAMKKLARLRVEK